MKMKHMMLVLLCSQMINENISGPGLGLRDVIHCKLMSDKHFEQANKFYICQFTKFTKNTSPVGGSNVPKISQEYMYV